VASFLMESVCLVTVSGFIPRTDSLVGIEFDSPALRVYYNKRYKKTRGLMGSDFADKLLDALVEGDHTQIFHARGCACPGVNRLSVQETFQKFCSEFLPLCPLVDPRGKEIRILKSHFPKLVDLEHATLDREDFPASQIVQCIENGSFNPDHYKKGREERIQMLFWIPDVVRDPDAIYLNGHKVVAGDEIYVKVYDKKGSKVKLVFTMDIRKKGKIISTVPVTSFLTNSDRALQMVKGEPLYIKK
jgi:hypothetical protein